MALAEDAASVLEEFVQNGIPFHPVILHHSS